MSRIVVACKRICIERSLKAICNSILIQFLLLCVYLLFVNFDILHPFDWLLGTFRLIFSIYTWLLIIPLLLAVTLYGFLLTRAHLAVKKYYASRFSWLVSNGLRKLCFFGMQILIGFLTAWLYVRYLHADYGNFIIQVNGSNYINCRYMFLINAGVFAGLFHFFKENLRNEPSIGYPLVQEEKYRRIRNIFLENIKTSMLRSFLPVFSYTFCYWLLQNVINGHIHMIFTTEIDGSLQKLFTIIFDFHLLFYTILLFSQIVSNFYIMQQLFSIFLSERIQFEIEESPMLNGDNVVKLVDALAVSDVHIIQTLAAIDLYSITAKCAVKRRQELLALSIPGGHPYIWTKVSNQCISMLNEFTEKLSQSFAQIYAICTEPAYNMRPFINKTAERLLIRQYNASAGIRRLANEEDCNSNTSNIMPTNKQQYSVNLFVKRLENLMTSTCHSIPGFFYIFGENDGARTGFLLANAQVIVWIINALGGLYAVSLLEDKYGVVQDGLKDLMKSLLRLKFELDKLNNVSINGNKTDPNLHILRSAVKRCIYRICNVFQNFLSELVDNPKDLSELHLFMNFNENTNDRSY